MQAQPLSNVLGAELIGFDMTRPLIPAEQSELRRLFARHHLLLVRGQTFTDADHDRFVKYFGPLGLNRDGAKAAYVTNRGKAVFGPGQTRLLWHADGTYGEKPGIATSLWAKDVGPGAASTQFTNAARALETLPRPLRSRVEGLTAVHLRNTRVERTAERSPIEEFTPDAAAKGIRCYEHPIVYHAPHIDMQVLLVNELLTTHIPGLPQNEGEALLQELFAHLYAAENVYTHGWRTGDLIIWDNIALQHCRPREVGAATRHLRRLTIDGWNTGDRVLEWPATGGQRDPLVAAA